MDRLWSLFHEHRLRQLFAFGLVVGTLGFVGYLSAGVSLLDSVYGTISLFTITFIHPNEIGGSDNVSLLLQIARFTAPLVTAGTALTAVLAILRDEVEVLRARRMKEHVIVCGAGERGRQLAVDLHENDRRVVVIENDPSVDLSPLRHRHIPVVVGDATDPAQLKRARAGRAERIIVVLDADDTNARCLTSLQTVPVEGRLQTVHCHVKSPSLDAYFTTRTTYSNVDSADRPGERQIEWFNIDRLAANILLNEHYGTTLQARRITEDGSDGRVPDGIAIVGISDLARSLLLQAATAWNEMRKSAGSPERWPRLPVTVIDEGSAPWIERLRGMASSLDAVLEVEAVQTSPFASEWDPSSVDVAYVTATDPIEALEIAHYLEVVKSGAAQIVVRGFVGAGGLATVLLEDDVKDDSIHMVNVIERTCTEEMVTDRLVQLLALENHLFQQVKERARPASRPWNELDPEVRKENEAAAIHHLTVKVPALGAKLVPTIGSNDDGSALQLTEAEVETLARLEAERRSRGRDGYHNDGTREENRKLVSGLPLMLNACGYRLVRDGNSPRTSEQQ